MRPVRSLSADPRARRHSAPPEAREQGAQLTVRLVLTSGLTLVGLGPVAATLAWLGWWRPVPAWVAAMLLVVGAWRATALISRAPTPRGVTTTVLVMAAAATAWMGLTRTEEVIVQHDASSYFQTAVALAETHTTPFPVHAGDVGGSSVLRLPHVTLSSPAFYQVGSDEAPAVAPQFLIGTTSWYSIGYWLGGADGVWWTAAVVGGLAVAAVGLLTGRLLGGAWGILAGAATAVCFPLVHVARTTYSEPLALLAVTTGLYLLVEASAARRPGARAARLGLLTGLVLGGACLIRLDGIREVMLVIPVAGLHLARSDTLGRHLLRGVGGSMLVVLVVWQAQNLNYLALNRRSVLGVLGLTGVVAVIVAIGVFAARRGSRVPPRLRTSLPSLALASVALAGVVLASRPLWLVAHSGGVNTNTEAYQAAQGLVVDGTRTYAEASLTWTSWWVGPVAVVSCFAVSAGLARSLGVRVRDHAPYPAWAGVFIIAFSSSVLVWWRPAITPEHPWADRRLFILLPYVIVTTVVGVAWLARRARPRHRWGSALVTVAGSLVLVVPTWNATRPHATERLGDGQYAAVRRACTHVGPDDVVLALDPVASYDWPQVIRGVCGVPTLAVDHLRLDSPVRPTDAEVRRTIARLAPMVQRSGKHLVLAVVDLTSLGTLVPAGLHPDVVTAMDETFRGDAAELTRRPDHASVDHETLYLASVPDSYAGG